MRLIYAVSILQSLHSYCLCQKLGDHSYPRFSRISVSFHLGLTAREHLCRQEHLELQDLGREAVAARRVQPEQLVEEEQEEPLALEAAAGRAVGKQVLEYYFATWRGVPLQE